jgi:protein SCO1/2
MKRLPQLPLLIALCVFAAIGIGLAVFLNGSGQPATQPSSVGGPFAMTDDSNGRTVTDADFKGQPFLVFFGYTHCPDVCPTELFQIAQVMKVLGPDTKIKVLFVTVDPERDTPKIMKDYVANFDPRIVALSGTEAQTRAMEKAYRVYAKKVPGKNGDYTMDHTAIVYLMDKDGRFVSALDLDRPAKVAAAELEKYL